MRGDATGKTTDLQETVIYTDGAFTPMSGKAGQEKEDRAEVGVYFGENDERNLHERLEGVQNNNS